MYMIYMVNIYIYAYKLLNVPYITSFHFKALTFVMQL